MVILGYLAIGACARDNMLKVVYTAGYLGMKMDHGWRMLDVVV